MIDLFELTVRVINHLGKTSPDDFGCDGTLSKTVLFLTELNCSEKQISSFLTFCKANGCWCDCEICLNSDELLPAADDRRPGGYVPDLTSDQQP